MPESLWSRLSAIRARLSDMREFAETVDDDARDCILTAVDDIDFLMTEIEQRTTG